MGSQIPNSRKKCRYRGIKDVGVDDNEVAIGMVHRKDRFSQISYLSCVLYNDVALISYKIIILFLHFILTFRVVGICIKVSFCSIFF